MLLAFGRFNAKNQHVFGQPAAIARHRRSDTQRKALLAKQRIATVARTVRPDFTGFGIMDDVFGRRIARPFRILLTRLFRRTNRMHARHIFAIGPKDREHVFAHARHDAHIDNDISRIGDLDTDLGNRRADRPHRERNHVHGATLHAAFEQAVQGSAHFFRVFPIVGRAGIFLLFGADESAVFDACDVRRVREG